MAAIPTDELLIDARNYLKHLPPHVATRKGALLLARLVNDVDLLRTALARWMTHPQAECVPTQAIAMGKRALAGEELADLDVVAIARKVEAENERLRDGYRWLEGLADGRTIEIHVNEDDGEISLSAGAFGITHIDLADLCIEQAANAAGSER